MLYAMAIPCIVFSTHRASIATLAFNSLSHLFRMMVVKSSFLLLGRLSNHSIQLQFRVQILSLIIWISV
jgi:hypothetical protein